MTGTSVKRLVKHSRSRAGCLTCRARRVKCDEVKPICGRCVRGRRECSYPPPPVKKRRSKLKKRVEKIVVVEQPVSTSESESSVNFDISDEEFEGETREGGLVRFSSSSSSPGSPMLCDSAADEFFSLQFEQPISLDSFDTSIDFVAEPLAMQSSQVLSLTIPDTNLSNFCEGILLQDRVHPKPALIRRTPIPRAPGPPRNQSVQFFLHFHRQTIMESHYCLYFDYNKFITTTLLAMAERSSTLRHAVVAFSALIYSIKGDRIAREQAFENYEISIQQLRILLDRAPMTVEERQAATVTALALASFDRFSCDLANCFRHLQGAAHIMQKFSDPVQHCSTPVDRSILEWFCNVEDYCCFLGAYKALLPVEYRGENVRIRQLLAHKEYPRLAPSDRKPRLLDDLWPQWWVMASRLGDVLATMPLLKNMNRPERSETASHLRTELYRFDREMTGLLTSAHVVELLQPGPYNEALETKHQNCCPSLSFAPKVFQFPPAGLFNIVVQSTQCYIRSTLYPSLRAELDFQQSIPELEAKNASHFSVEICRTFAGVEYSFPDRSADVIFACFSSLVMAALTCPPELRIWIWCKLAHFERVGKFCFEPVKKNLAMLWDMPEILRDGFSPLAGGSPQHESQLFLREETSDEEALRGVALTDESDDSLESLRQLRGLFGLMESDE